MNIQKIALLLLLVPLLSTVALAQNNLIFYGGVGNGSNINSYSSNYTLVTNGGVGQGSSQGGYNTVAAELRVGGPGEGSAFSGYATTAANIRVGGFGEGSATQMYEQQYVQQRLGGVGEGSAQLMYASAYAEPRKGGIGDGYASVVIPAIPLNPLSAEMLSFTGARVNDEHLLEWQTKEDGSTAHYILERSKNSYSWTAQSTKIIALGEASNNYSYTDDAPLTGNNFYRLRITDHAGNFKYSNVVTLVQDQLGSLSIYPNPTASELFIDLSSTKGISTITLLSSSGQVLYAGECTSAIHTINIGSYTVGTYMLKIQNTQQQFVYKVLKR